MFFWRRQSVVFVCVWNISGAKFTRKTCWVPRSDEFEGQGQKSRSPGIKKTFLSVACVRFMFGKASLGSSYNCFMCVHLRWAWRSSSRDVYQNSLFARDLICSEALLNCWVLSNELRFYVSDRQKILVILETFFPASLLAYYWNSKAVYRKPANDDLVSCYELLM